MDSSTIDDLDALASEGGGAPQPPEADRTTSPMPAVESSNPGSAGKGGSRASPLQRGADFCTLTFDCVQDVTAPGEAPADQLQPLNTAFRCLYG